MSSGRLWARGDYSQVARRLQPVAAALVETAEIDSTHRLLDAAAGTGNVALAAAATGAEVIAYDITGELVRQGRDRSADVDASIAWLEADAQYLPFADGSFDRVLSVFGMIYAPEPSLAASEALRCLAPGGRVAITAWTKRSFSSASRLVMERFTGPSRGPATENWAELDFLREIFPGRNIELTEHVLLTNFESPDAWWRQARDAAPPLVAVRESLDEAAFEQLGQELVEVAERFREPGRSDYALHQDYAVGIVR